LKHHAKLNSDGSKSDLTERLRDYLCSSDEEAMAPPTEEKKRRAFDAADDDVKLQRPRIDAPEPATPSWSAQVTGGFTPSVQSSVKQLSGWWKRYNCVTNLSRCCGVDSAGDFVVSDPFQDVPVLAGVEVTDKAHNVKYVLHGQQCAPDEVEDMFGPHPDVMRGGGAVHLQLGVNAKDFCSLFRLQTKKVNGSQLDLMSSVSYSYNMLKLVNAMETHKGISQLGEEEQAHVPPELAASANRCAFLYEELKKETAVVHDLLYRKDKKPALMNALAMPDKYQTLKAVHSRRIECLEACEQRAAVVRRQNADEKEMESRIVKAAVQEKKDMIRGQLALVESEISCVGRKIERSSGGCSCVFFYVR
jgi:hypothetical protein